MNVSLSGNVAPLVLVEPECVEQAAAPVAYLLEVAVLFPSLKALGGPRSLLQCQASFLIC